MAAITKSSLNAAMDVATEATKEGLSEMWAKEIVETVCKAFRYQLVKALNAKQKQETDSLD